MRETFRSEKNKEKGVENIRSQLIATGKVEEFIDFEKLDLPQVPNGVPRGVATGVFLIDKVLGLPIIVDAEGAFKDHKERRLWRSDELSLPVREIYEGNALGLNNIGAALSGAEYAIQSLKDKKKASLLEQERKTILKKVEHGWGDNRGNEGHFTVNQKKDFLSNELRPYLLKVREAVLGVV